MLQNLRQNTGSADYLRRVSGLSAVPPKRNVPRRAGGGRGPEAPAGQVPVRALVVRPGVPVDGPLRRDVESRPPLCRPATYSGPPSRRPSSFRYRAADIPQRGCVTGVFP